MRWRREEVEREAEAKANGAETHRGARYPRPSMCPDVHYVAHHAMQLLLVGATGERMRRRLRLRDDGVDLRLVLHGASDRLLRRLIVVGEDLLVVRGIPVDEHADDDDEVIDLVLRNDAGFNGIDDGTRNGRLRRSKHLNRLLRALDRDLVEQDRVRLGRKVRSNDGEQ